MSETKEYLILKSSEPEALGDVYASSLMHLPGEEIDLTPDLPIIQKLRPMTPEQAKMVAARGHVLSVEPNEEAHAMGFASVQAAENMSPGAIKKALGVDRCHEAGVKGAGQKSAVVDSGMGASFAEKYASSIVEKRDYTGEGWKSPDDTHGEWCASAVLMIAPESRVGVFKALSGESGSGSYSGIIKAISDAVGAGYTGITLSLGGPKSDAVNNAVDAAESKGVHVTSAAGNEQRNSTAMTADNTSPASAKDGTTCGAKKSDGGTSSFSNWGNCVDVGCYGENVEAPDVNGFWDGTSMSTPEVQGVLNLIRSTGAPKDEAKKRLYGSAKKTGEPVYKEGYGLVDAAGAVLGSAPEEPSKPEPPAQPVPSKLPRVKYSSLRLSAPKAKSVYTVNGKDVGTAGPLEG